MRVAFLRFEAVRVFDLAERILRHPPHSLSTDVTLDIARRYRERAKRIEAEADRLEAAGKVEFPVAAARMELDFGETVGIG
jgi:hypothetical protein